MPLPIDLQVVFSKAHEYAENIGRNNAIIEAGRFVNQEKMHKQSQETNEQVSKMEEYAQDFTKVNAEPKERKGAAYARQKKQGEKKEENAEEHKKSALKEDGTGNIIDILD